MAEGSATGPGSPAAKSANWLEISDRETLQGLLSPGSGVVFLFKHSSRCPISAWARQGFVAFAEAALPGPPRCCAHLDLIRHRDLSDAVAEATGVRHQSPQALLLVDGEVRWHASHQEISVDSLSRALAALPAEE